MKHKRILLTLGAITMGLMSAGCVSVTQAPQDAVEWKDVTAVTVKVLRPPTAAEQKQIKDKSNAGKIAVYDRDGNALFGRLRIDDRLFQALMSAGQFDLIRRLEIDPFCPGCNDPDVPGTF